LPIRPQKKLKFAVTGGFCKIKITALVVLLMANKVAAIIKEKKRQPKLPFKILFAC